MIHIILLCVINHLYNLTNISKNTIKTIIYKFAEINYLCHWIIQLIQNIFLSSNKKVFIYDSVNLIYTLIQIILGIDLCLNNSSENEILSNLRLFFLLGFACQLKSTRLLIKNIFFTLPSLFIIFITCLFVIWIYSILGINFLGEAIGNRCRVNPEPDLENLIWKIDSDQFSKLCGWENCDKGTYCGSWDNYDLTPSSFNLNSTELNYGFTKFTNLGSSFHSVLIIIAGDNWSPLLYQVKKKY